MPLVLLDTAVASGIFSHLKSNATEQENDFSKEWQKIVIDFVREIPDGEAVIPTPVFHELASRNDDYMKIVMGNADPELMRSPLMKYASYSIGADLLRDASKYRLRHSKLAGKKSISDEEKHPISFVDSLLAAYCFDLDVI